MATVTGELVRAQAAELREVELDIQRAQELAEDVAKINAAAAAARGRLDFNDEPARFLALLCAPPASPRSPRKRK
jgi:hypothetical protein